ncbi:MAG: hypothetical protein Q4E33_05190 [Erysipelotrichaceae bacterium]|nr:hypothetical protein [Erysipelotrichaceae bacterium]
MAKTQTELNELKNDLLKVNKKLQELSEEELYAVVGGIQPEVEPKDRDIAMVFQNYAIYPHMEVFDNYTPSALSYGLRQTNNLNSRVSEEPIVIIDDPTPVLEDK